MLDHGGVIVCDSQPEAGATFTLLFPVQESVRDTA
jgi:signal transduction histidine kinase